MEKRKFNEWLKSSSKKIEYSKENIDEKIKAFEYFVYTLIRQTKNLEELKSSNFSILKVQLLLFFLVSKETKLLDVFDNWYALPYGNIEADIYRYIRHNKGKFSFFTLTRFGIKLEYNNEAPSKP